VKEGGKVGGGEWVWQLLAQIVLAVVAVIVMDEFPWLSCWAIYKIQIQTW